MGNLLKAFLQGLWNKLILQKAQRVERRARELLGMQVIPSVVPNTKIAPHAFDDLNTGKLKKFIQWLKSNK
jgi:hypothetical protein